MIYCNVEARLAVSRTAFKVGRRAITKVEVLIALALCIAATGFIVMLLARHRENAQRVSCTNNLRVIGQAIHIYHEKSAGDEKRRYLPPARIADGYATWAVLIAPYMKDEHPLHQWKMEQSYFAQADDVRQAPLFSYFCPARRRPGVLSEAGDLDKGTFYPGALGDYGIVAGDGSIQPDWLGAKANGAIVAAVNLKNKDDRVIYWESVTGLSSLVRGTQYTFLVSEKQVPSGNFGDAAFGDGSLYNGANPASFARVAGSGFPIAPSMLSPFNNNFGSYHDGICNFLMADGSVRPMTNNTSEAVLGQLARRGE